MFFFQNLHAQEAQQMVPVAVSPEAAALAKMVNYPVNLNTGVPDINIPFYEINAGGLKLPVALNYHAGGFRINEQSTRAGLGWSLSSDLQITRTVNGLDDFKGAASGYLANNLLKAFYISYSSCTSCPYPLYSAYPFPYSNSYYLATGWHDGMPDKFTYKLLNKSGSFYFLKDNSGTSYVIAPVPFDNIKIEFTNQRFVITDTDGTVYYFGKPFVGGSQANDLLSRGIEVSDTGQESNCGSCVRSAWKCVSIVNSRGTDEIEFAYTPKAPVQYRTYRDRIEYYRNDSPCDLSVYAHSNEYPLNITDQYNNMNVPFHQISSPKYMEIFGYTGISQFHVPYLDANNEVVDKVYYKTDWRFRKSRPPHSVLF